MSHSHIFYLCKEPHETFCSRLSEPDKIEMGDMGHWDSGTKLHLTQNQTKTSMKSIDSIIHEFIS